MKRRDVDRRAFLARLGVLGAVAGAGVAMPGVASAVTAPTRAMPGLLSLDVVKDLLASLAEDTLNGLTTFVVPGPDAYSAAQGTPREEPGALEAKATAFLIDSLDNYVPLPDQLSVSLGNALADGLGDVELPLPGGIGGLLSSVDLISLDDAVLQLLRNDETLPLSLVIALLLNAVATQVNPASVNGLFLSPFARLRFAEKAEVFRQFEEPNAALVEALDSNLPEPLQHTASGMLQFVAGALLEFSAIGTYCEWSTFDPDSRWVTEPPVGWALSGYDPGVMDGWDEFKGYYQGRRKVSSR